MNHSAKTAENNPHSSSANSALNMTGKINLNQKSGKSMLLDKTAG
jgi:hypothetical protein